MFTLHKHLEINFDRDTYIARVRCGYPHLLLNAGYDGIRVINCLAGTEIGAVAFPETDFAIYTWVVSPDGKKSYLFSPDKDDTDYALELDLEQLRSRKIALVKGFEPPTELCWFSPNLHILDYHYIVWTVENDTLVKASAEAADRLYTTPFRRITKRFVVEKMDPFGEGVYAQSREYPTRYIGRLSLAGESPLLMEQDRSVIDVTHYGNSLFACAESTILQHRNEKSVPALLVSEDAHFLCVNVIRKNEVGYLTVLSSTKDYLTGPVGTLAVYRLQE